MQKPSLKSCYNLNIFLYITKKSFITNLLFYYISLFTLLSCVVHHYIWSINYYKEKIKNPNTFKVLGLLISYMVHLRGFEPPAHGLGNRGYIVYSKLSKPSPLHTPIFNLYIYYLTSLIMTKLDSSSSQRSSQTIL